MYQQTLLGVPAAPAGRAMTLMYGQAVPRVLPDPDATLLEQDPDESTWVGPPEPAWANHEMAAPTLLDSQPPFKAVTPAGGHPAVPASVVPTPTPVPEGLPAISADTLAAARFEQEAENTQAQFARQRRRRGQVLLWLVIGVVILGGFAFWRAQRFRAELAGALAVTRTSSGYAVTVGLKTSAPAQVQHPGGQTAVDGTAQLQFEIDETRMALGDNPIVLTARDAGGAEQVLTVHVMVHYHLHTAPVPSQRGAPVIIDLTLQPGWRAELASTGSVQTVDNGARLRVDPTQALDATPAGQPVILPVKFTLHSPDGTAHDFVEQVRLPPRPPELKIIEPVRGWALAKERVWVRGRTAPGARIRIGALQKTANTEGDFEAWVPLPAEGTHRLRIETLAPHDAAAEIDVRRVHPTIAQAQLTRARAATDGAIAVAWRPDLPNGRYLLNGTLLATQRGDAQSTDAAIINVCPQAANPCRLRAVLAHAPLATHGQAVRVGGALEAGVLRDAWVMPRVEEPR